MQPMMQPMKHPSLNPSYQYSNQRYVQVRWSRLQGINQVTLNSICVGIDIGLSIGSANRITIIDDRARTRVKSDTVKLSPFQDDDDIDLEDVCDNDTPDLDITTIWVITTLCSGLDFSEDNIPTGVIQIVINSITSQTITPAEQALGKFTRR